MLLLRLLEEVVWLLFPGAQYAASEEDINRVIVVNLLLSAEADHDARCQLPLDQVFGQLHVSSLHDFIELVGVPHRFIGVGTISLLTLQSRVSSAKSHGSPTRLIKTRLHQLVSKHLKAEHSCVELHVLDGLNLLEVVVDQIVV